MPLPDPGPSPAGELRRAIGFWGGVATVVGTTVGSGVFRMPGRIADLVHDPLLILGLWAAFGLIVVCGALTLAELASRFPKTGGLYVFLRAAYGDAAAFVFGWLYLLVTVPAAMAGLAVFFAELVTGLGHLRQAWAIPAAAVVTIAALAAANVLGVRKGLAIQGLFTVVKVGAIGLMIAAVFLSGRGEVAHYVSGPAAAPLEWRGLALAMSSFMWTYSGWQAVTMVAGEISDPGRHMTRIILVGTLLVGVLYVGANAAYFFALPLEAMRGEKVVAQKAVAAVAGPAGAGVLGLCIMASVFGALNGQILAKTRVPYALARDGLAFRFLGTCHARWATPHASILVSSAVAILLVLWLKDFIAITTYFAVVEWFALLFSVGAVFVLRRRRPDGPAGYRVPLYPWLPLLFVAGAGTGLAAVLWGQAVQRNWPPLIGLAISLLGFPVFLLWRRWGGARPKAAA